MSDRLARLGLGVVTGLVLLLAVVVDLPATTDGRFWSDGATYHAMAGSLAFDRDLEFTAGDLARVKNAYPGGPRGDTVTARRGWRSARVRVGPGEERELEIAVGRGVRYYDTYLHVLRLESRRGASLPDGRVVGAFVELRLVTRPLPGTAGAP